jgi:succinate dehydrogenase/fumarate reductase flavoprotein subunit
MMEKVGIFREKQKLLEALENIRELRQEYHQLSLRSDCLQYCQELVTMMEFESMLDIAEVITMGALAREETRGSHFRLDFPQRDDENWLKHTIAEFKEGGPRLSYRAVRITRYQPKERKY